MERKPQGTLKNEKPAGIFFRVHRSEVPTFCADNAVSSPWGDESEDRDTGYSCCETPAELIAYFETRGCPEDSTPVVVFWGKRVGTGMDMEPLAVPFDAMRARWMTWGELAATTRK